MNKQGFVYILASDYNGTLYIDATTDLIKRIYEHKEELVEGFTKKYKAKTLVYYEVFDNYEDAFTREKHLKAWKREWKIKLIEKANPRWEDLYSSLISG